MPILQNASLEDRQRLLELFPVSNLRAAFPYHGTKQAICRAAASSGRAAALAKIVEFVDINLSSCKQHVYVLSHQGDVALPNTIPGGEVVLMSPDHGLYLIRITFEVLIFEPPERTTLEFLWPVRIDLTARHLVLRFVVLEKNPTPYFEGRAVVRGKSMEEETVIADILSDGRLSRADLNRGVKALWAEDHYDAIRTRYKKSKSVASEAMDEERGIKQFNPNLYEDLRNKPLYSTVFKGRIEGAGIQAFSADPTNGQIGFTRYSKEGGDSDELIRQILENN